MWIRVLLAVLLLAAVQVAVWMINERLRPDTIEPISTPLGQLPRQLGNWTGRDVDLDSRLMEAAYATDLVNREYTSTDGVKLQVQVASFDRYESGVPHLPEGCYTGSGCVVIGRDKINLRKGPDAAEPAYLISFDREGKQISLLYWFRLADQQIADNVDLLAAKKTLFGEKRWPSIVKVMIHSNSAANKPTRDALRELGELIFAWTRSLSTIDGKPPAEAEPPPAAKPSPKAAAGKTAPEKPAAAKPAADKTPAQKPDAAKTPAAK